VSRVNGHTVYLTATEAVLKLFAAGETARDVQSVADQSYSLDQRTERGACSTVLRIRLIGATPAQSVEGLDELPGKSNYFIGNDPKNWRAGVKSFSRVRYRSVYPGVDLVYHSDRGKVEYDFELAPRANPRIIRLAFKGAARVRVDKSGDLVLNTPSGEVRQRRPTVFQEVRGARKQIPARFVKRGKDQIGFRVAGYDRRKPLVIDPVLIYSTYLGGSGLDSAQAVAVDNNGYAYITGSTRSTNFPTADPFQPAIGGVTSDVFVSKLNPDGSALVYSTYLGGGFSDSAFGIALDSLGNAYVTGETSSLNFPTANALQGEPGGQTDAFVTKLNSQGSMLVYSSYLGGAFNDSGRGIAVDVSGAAHVIGNTESPDFPLANALRSTIGQADGFVSKYNVAGTAMVYSTYLGGSGNDSAVAITLDADGNAYVTGGTRSSDFPAINALQSSYGDKTLFKSTDSGASWQSINNGLPGSAAVLALAIDPQSTSTLYAGTDSAGCFKSTDGGSQWVPAAQGLAESTSQFDLGIDPLTPSILYAAASANVYKSTSGGDGWSVILDTFSNSSVAIDPASPSTVYIASFPQGVLLTTDGGQIWENTDFPFANARVNCLALDPTHPGSFYAGTETSGIHRYPTPCASIPLSSGPVRCVAVSNTTPSTVYAGTGSGGIYRSTDAGVTWKQANSGLTESTLRAVAIDPINPLTVYAATPTLCYKSTDGGDNWNSLVINPQSPTIYVNEIAIDPSDPSTLYAAASGGGDAYITELNASGTAYIYSTFLGGSGGESGAGVAVDSSGGVYVVGSTNSRDIPSANPVTPLSGSSDALVARITSGGGSMSFFAYLGGSNSEAARAVAIDPLGGAWVVGDTRSADFPTTPDSIPRGSPCPAGICAQSFVSRINSVGTLLSYSTYLGGSAVGSSSSGFGNGVAVDASGSAYVAGQTFSADFPTTPGTFQEIFGGGTSDAFVAKIGSPCVYSLSKTSQVSPPNGGSGEVDLTTAIGCAWSAVSNDGWITITSSDSGNGRTVVSFEVRENFAPEFRIGTLTIAGQTFTVIQEGLASIECSNSISPRFNSFPSSGGLSSVDVIAANQCIWSAVSNSNWITITSNDNGIGVGEVKYSVAVNPGAAARKGTITIAGQTISIKQKGNASSHR
jgi:hypothetical protein